jgi:type IV pilus assembly protein PilC
MTTRPSRPPVADLVIGVAIPALLWAVLLVGLVLVVPRFKRIFMDFGLALPAATQAVIAVSDWAAAYWYVLILSVPFLLAPDVAVVYWLARRPGRALSCLWFVLMIALPLLAMVLVFVAIYLPEAKLLEDLSK